MKKILGILTALILFLMIPAFSAAAETVDTTREPAAGQTVYIAGNPDLYPLEYYQPEKDCYAGLLPCVYQKISEATGLEFTYIRAGNENQQERMANNNQVEIVSVHFEEELPSVFNKFPLFTFEDADGEHTVCIAFTEIAAPEIIRAVKHGLYGITKEEYLEYAMGLSRKKIVYSPFGFLISAGTLIALSVISGIFIHRKRKKKREAERHSKMTDALTGIGNQAYFQYSFDHYVPEAAQELYYTAYISLNMKKMRQYFSEIHAEEIQKYAADILSSSCQDNDFAARINDGVFAVTFMADSRAKAETRVTEWLSRLNQYEHQMLAECQLSFCAGIHPVGRGKVSSETVVFNARQGCIYAIQNKLPLCFTNEKILSWAAMNKRLRQKLREAIANHEFCLYLQFIADDSGRLCAAEALTRWHSPEEGILTPNYYIENLIDLGIIDQLDFWVLEQVCRLLEKWKGTKYGNLHISCNFTRQTFSMEDFMEKFTDVISRYHFDRQLLTLELTEDTLIHNSAVTYRNIVACKNLQCAIALDDFGSGYTSFSDLFDYPIDIIKLDRSIMVKGMNSKAKTLLKGIAGVAHELEILVLCEGVETEEELALAHYLKSDLVQGFYYCRVLPEEEALNFLEKYNTRHFPEPEQS